MAARQKREAAEKPQRRRGAPARPPKTGIGMLLRDADTAFNRYLTAQLAAHGVTFGQFQHLRNLWVENGLTQAELSRRIGIEMASSTAILDSLEAAKLITRVRNTTDRRKINVFLTPAGAALEKALMACAADANKRASKGLTQAEVAQLFALAGQTRVLQEVLGPLRDDFDAVFDNTSYRPSDLEPLVELFRGRVQHFVFTSSTAAYRPGSCWATGNCCTSPATRCSSAATRTCGTSGTASPTTGRCCP